MDTRLTTTSPSHISRAEILTRWCFALALTGSSLAYADSATLTGDSYVSGKTPNAINGKKNAILVQEQAHDGYLKFNLGYTGSVAKAKLRVFVSTVKKPGTLVARDVPAGWDELALKLSNVPVAGNALNVPAAVSALSKNNWIDFDVTAYVQEQVTSSASEVAFALVGTNELNVQLDSKESATTSHQPELEITWASAGAQGPQGIEGPQGVAGPAGP